MGLKMAVIRLVLIYWLINLKQPNNRNEKAFTIMQLKWSEGFAYDNKIIRQLKGEMNADGKVLSWGMPSAITFILICILVIVCIKAVKIEDDEGGAIHNKDGNLSIMSTVDKRGRKHIKPLKKD